MHHMRWDAIRVQGVVPSIKNHTATAISRSELLVFGGYDGRRNHNTLYLFNSETSTWTQLGEPLIKGTPPAGRNGHTATLADNKLFIIGGWLGSGPLAADDMHVLDLTTMSWHEPPVVGKPPGPCNMHTADYIAHMKSILVFRGGDGREYLNDLHALHVETMEWRCVAATGRRPVPRANHSSTLVDGDQIVIFGGWDGHRRLNDIHVLDARSMVWSTVDVHGSSIHSYGAAALPHPRAGMTFVRHRERVFLFGGSGPSAKCYNDLHVYDAHETKWVDVTALPDEQQLPISAILAEEDDGDDTENENGSFSPTPFVNTSSDEYYNTREYSSSDEYYYSSSPDQIPNQNQANPNDIHSHHHRRRDQIVLLGMGPGRRAGHTCTVLEDRKLFIFGGSCGNEYLNDLFLLDTDPAPRAQISSALSPLHCLQRSLGGFVNNESFSDISFVVEGRVVYAHKLILSVLSERFRVMFSGGFRESQQTQIVVPEIRYVVFVKMLEYLYTGNCLEYHDDEEEEERGDGAGAAAGDGEQGGGDEGEGGGAEDVYDEVDDCRQSRRHSRRRMTNGNDAGGGHGYGQWQQQDGGADRPTGPRRSPGKVSNKWSSPSPPSTSTRTSSGYELDVLLELLVVADQFMLDHLKQYCERILQPAVQVETVADILAAANESNAIQLKAICMHFLRNHDLQWGEEEDQEEEESGERHHHHHSFDGCDHDDEEEEEDGKDDRQEEEEGEEKEQMRGSYDGQRRSSGAESCLL